MTCQGCSVKLRKTLASVDGVEIKNISYRTGDVDLALSNGATTAQVEEAIKKSGFSFVPGK